MTVRVPLTENELSALARRIMYLQIKDTESWLWWENYPELGEFEFERLDERVRHFAQEALRRCDDDDRLGGIDSRKLLEDAS